MSMSNNVLADVASLESLRTTRFIEPSTLAEAEAILRQLAESQKRPLAIDAPQADELDITGSSAWFEQPTRSTGPVLERMISVLQPLNRAYEAVPDALLVVDTDGTITLVNSHLESMFGYPRERLVGNPIEVLMPDWFRAAHPLKRSQLDDESHVRPSGAGFELQGRHRHGDEIPLEISLSPLETELGTMAVATIRDLTQQRRTEAQIRRFEARYRNLVEGLPAVTFMAALDDEVNELYVSPQIETLLGFSQDEWLGNPILWYTQLHPDDRHRWHNEFAHTCFTGENFQSIYRFIARNGRVVWVHGEAKVVRDEQGRPLFLQGVAFDITDMKEAEESLRQLNQTLESRVAERTSELVSANESLHLEVRERQRAETEIRRVNAELAQAHEAALSASQIKSQFLANMSHELRTPLNAIIGYSELLQILATRKNDTSLNADLNRINRAGKHLLALINDILDISKIEAGKMQLELETIGVEPLIEEIVQTIEPLATENGNSLDVQIAEHLGLTEADPVRLKQCLLNLLSNACKFTKQGRVALSITQETIDQSEWLCFRVSDTGIGLTEEQIARLFQPFTQADATTTRRFGGTGLGLAITKRLCEAMHGRITLTSRLGEGSTFTIELPVKV